MNVWDDNDVLVISSLRGLEWDEIVELCCPSACCCPGHIARHIVMRVDVAPSGEGEERVKASSQ